MRKKGTKYTEEQRFFWGKRFEEYCDNWKKSDPEKEKTVNDFCDLLDISPQSYNNYKNGGAPDSAIENICEKLEVDPIEWTTVTKSDKNELFKEEIKKTSLLAFIFDVGVMVLSLICMAISWIKHPMSTITMLFALCFVIALANFVILKQYDRFGKEVVPKGARVKENKITTIICFVMVGIIFLFWIVMLLK